GLGLDDAAIGIEDDHGRGQQVEAIEGWERCLHGRSLDAWGHVVSCRSGWILQGLAAADVIPDLF
ncbi:hypothetical protein ABEP89_12270, partial [Cutibacterium acnes]